MSNQGQVGHDDGGSGTPTPPRLPIGNPFKAPEVFKSLWQQGGSARSGVIVWAIAATVAFATGVMTGVAGDSHGSYRRVWEWVIGGLIVCIVFLVFLGVFLAYRGTGGFPIGWLRNVPSPPPHEAPPTTVLLSPDFNAPSPLWPLSAATDAMVPQTLLDELIAWQSEFDSNYDWETGWRSEEAKRDWAAASIGLVDKVRGALAGKADLTVNLWPLDEPERHYP